MEDRPVVDRDWVRQKAARRCRKETAKIQNPLVVLKVADDGHRFEG